MNKISINDIFYLTTGPKTPGPCWAIQAPEDTLVLVFYEFKNNKLILTSENGHSWSPELTWK